MRRWSWLGFGIVISAGAVGALVFLTLPAREPRAETHPPVTQELPPLATAAPMPIPDEMPSPVLEPIVVEGLASDDSPTVCPGEPSVVRALGLQPTGPRPEGIAALRMPYADEQPSPFEILAPLLNPLARLAQRLEEAPLLPGVFDDTEESSEPPVHEKKQN